MCASAFFCFIIHLTVQLSLTQVWHFPLIKEAARLTKQFIMTQRAHKVPVSSKHLWWAIVVKPFSLATCIYQDPRDKQDSMRYFLKRGCAAIDYHELYATLPDPEVSSKVDMIMGPRKRRRGRTLDDETK